MFFTFSLRMYICTVHNWALKIYFRLTSLINLLSIDPNKYIKSKEIFNFLIKKSHEIVWEHWALISLELHKHLGHVHMNRGLVTHKICWQIASFFLLILQSQCCWVNCLTMQVYIINFKAILNFKLKVVSTTLLTI